MGNLLRQDRGVLVHPRLRLFAVQMASQSPYNWLLVTGVRTQADVEAKYAQGRTAPGPHAGEPGYPPLGETVTNVHTLALAPHALRVTPAGTFGCAIDLQYFLPDGLHLAEGKVPEEQLVYRGMGEQAEKAGLAWGGRFIHLFDQAHVELPDWRAYPLPPPETA